MSVLVDRMVRAAKLDVSLYEEVEGERGAQMQAVGVVVISSLAFGIGTGAGIGGLVSGTIAAVIGWYIWAFLTYIIGTRFLPEKTTQADHGELLRTMGFANAPGVVSILGVIPGLRGIAITVAQVWMLVAGIVAIRSALDYQSTIRAIVVVVIGWIIRAILIIVIVSLLGDPGPRSTVY
jgi:hypothetical protein